MELLLVLLWRFWFRRNRAVHSASLLSVEDTVGWSERYLVDFQAAVAVSRVRCDLVVERWLAPSPGVVKLNLNVALDSSRSLVGVRLVLRDDERRVLGSSWQCFSGNLFPLDAEGATVLRGLQFALDVGVSFIVVESDASSLVGFINDNVMSFSEIGLVVVEIQKLCLNFQNYLVIFGAMKVN
ncbi:hypothetical protein ACOSQ4_023300 [Xanthoceras sorbifolium]